MSNEVLYLGGIFNYTDPLFGFQLYIWSWLALIFLSVIAWLAWRYGQWEPFKPLWGLYHAFKASSNAAFIFNMALICELWSERQAKCIFDYSKWTYEGIAAWQKPFFNYATAFLPDLDFAHALLYKYGGRNMDVEIARKMQNNEWEEASSVNAGGIHTDMILDADSWSVRASPQHKIVEKFCETHNQANESDQIHSYPKFQRLLSERVITAPEGIKPFVTIPWVRIDSTFPIDVGDNTTLGAVRQAAIEMENEDATSLSKYYFPILGGGFGFALLLLAMRFSIHIFKL